MRAKGDAVQVSSIRYLARIGPPALRRFPINNLGAKTIAPPWRELRISRITLRIKAIPNLFREIVTDGDGTTEPGKLWTTVPVNPSPPAR